MRKKGKWLVIGLLVGGATGCVRLDQPIHPQYEIGEPYCVIRDNVDPELNVKKAIEKLFTLLSVEPFRSRFQ